MAISRTNGQGALASGRGRSAGSRAARSRAPANATCAARCSRGSTPPEAAALSITRRRWSGRSGTKRHSSTSRKGAGGDARLVEEVGVDPVGEALHMERPATKVRQRAAGDVNVVGDEVALGQPALGEEHLVGARDRDVVPADSHHESVTKPRGRSCRRRGRLARPDEICDAAVRARGPAGVRVRAVDGVEAAVVEALPRGARIGADVAPGGADRERGVPVQPGRAGAVLGGRAGRRFQLAPPSLVRAKLSGDAVSSRKSPPTQGRAAGRGRQARRSRPSGRCSSAWARPSKTRRRRRSGRHGPGLRRRWRTTPGGRAEVRHVPLAAKANSPGSASASAARYVPGEPPSSVAITRKRPPTGVRQARPCRRSKNVMQS